jgi:membrane fusion protein (multidrug efflux system)
VAVQNAVVSTEVEGVVRAIRFESGTAVKAGEVLVELDTELEKVQLREAEVAAESARTSFQRAIELNRSRNISAEAYDLVETNVKRTEIQVEYYRTLIGKKTVKAPFSGRLGLRTISIGQYLPKGSPLVTLQSLDPIHVEFSVPQHQFGLLDEGLQADVGSDAWPGEVFTGKVTAITPDVALDTRSVRVQATLPNAQGRLRPGMSVGVTLLLASRESVLLIPATAVVHSPYGDSVFVIEPDATASGESPPNLVLRQQPVRLGGKQGDFVTVAEGLAQGQQVVSTGVFKYRPGMQVVVDNRLAPNFSLSPRPDNS